MRYFILIFSLLAVLISKEAKACHGVALVGFSASAGPTSVTVNGSSNSATCGCGPYYLEVQLACFSPANFSPTIPPCTGTWNVYPFYRSGLNIPNPMNDNCITEPYFPVVIPFSQLCPGTVYVLRARERVCGSGSAGPWSSTVTFTTPGLPPSFGLSAAASPTTVCPGGPTTLSATLTGLATCGSGTPTFTWQPGNITGQTVTVNPTVTTTYTVSATGGYLTCYSVPPAVVTVTVQPAPSIGVASVSPTTVCAGGCVTLSLSSFTGGSLQWQSSPNAVTWSNIPGATTLSYLFCPVTAPMFFRAQVIGAPGCGTATSNVISVGVTPVPTLSVSPASPSFCIGQSVTLNVTGASSYTWTGPNSFSGSGSSITITPTSTGTYTVTSGGLCPGSQTVTVTVNPLPTVTASASTSSICIGSSTTLSAGGAQSYVWSPGNQSGPSITVSPTSTTTYTVTGTDANGCVNTGTVQITVNPLPAVTATASAPAICNGGSTTLTAIGASTYAWLPGNLSGSSVTVSPTATTTYTVTGSSGAGCSDTGMVTIVVNPLPSITATPPSASICIGSSVTITAAGGSSYAWAPGNFTTATVTVTPPVSTTYTVTGTDVNGCINTASATVTVNPLPTLTASASTSSICIGSSTTLSAGGAQSYVWSPGNQSGSTITVSPTTTTTYTVTGTDANGCVNTGTVQITVNPLPVVTATASIPAICIGGSTALTASGASTYTWLPGNLSGSSVTVSPTATTTYTVTGTSGAGCIDTGMVTIIVNPLPSITATPPSTSICIGSSVTITAAGGNSYAWAPGNFTTATVTVTPTVSTTYTVTGTNVNGCINTASATVTVNPLPTLTASASTSSICIGSSTTLSAGGAQSYVWSPGNQSGPTITVSPTSTTTYTVTGTDANGCVNTGTVQITVNPLPAVTSVASIPAICIGGSTTLTASGASTYAWLPGNLSGSSITVSPTATTTYTVTGTSSAGCVNTSIITVTVSTLPNVLANTNDPIICSGESTLLTASGATTYAWSPGNQTGASISVSPSASTTYTVIGTSSAGCLDTATISITVNTVPIINLNPQSITICEGFSAGVDAGLDTNNYTWSPSIGVNIITSSGDSVVVNPSATTVYTVISTSPQGCSDTATISVIVNPDPILALSMDTLILCPTQTDTISVSGASTYSWSSNSNWSPLTTNNSSVSIGPVASNATYTVVGTSAAGCSDTLVLYSEMQNVIAVNAYSDTTVCSGSTVTLNATGGNQYSWTSMSSSTIVNANAASPSVTVTNTSVFVVSVINQNGCFGSDSVTITTLALPPANAGLDDTICFGQSTVLSGSGGNSYVWMGSSIVSGSNTATPTVAPSSTSNYYMSVVDANGCQNSDTVTVTVIQLPIAAAGPDLFYCGTCVTMTGSGGTSYLWSPPTGLSTPTAAVTQACPLTTTSYTLTVTDNFGCSSQDSALVTVYPPLQLQVSPAITICNGSGTTISGIASGGDGGPYTYSWSPSTGLNNAAIANPTASPTVTTTYVLTVSDQCGSPVISDSIVVTVYSSPTLSLSADIVEGCAPLCVNFVGTSSPSASICNIDFGDLTNAASCAASHCYDEAGTYSITFSVTDMNGCVTSQTYANMIVVHPIPVAGFTASPDTASILSPMFYFDPNCTFCDTTIYSMGDASGGIVSNLNQPFNYSYQDTGWYTVVQSVISEHGCVASDSINIYVKPDWSFYAPNAFTPNEDGINEVFFVSGTGIDPETFNLYIFDRWGNLLFFTDDINQGWNGRVLGGEICQIDTYVWKCDFVNVLGKKQSVMGSVNLIK